MAAPTYIFLFNEQADTEVGVMRTVFSSAFETPNVSESLSVNLLAGNEETSVEFDISAQNYTSAYFSINLSVGITGTVLRPVFLLKGATVDMLRIYVFNTAEEYRVELWNGSSWDQIGSDITDADLNTGRKIDLWLSIANSGGRLKLDVDGVNKIDFTGDTDRTTDANIDFVKLANPVDNIATSFYYTRWQALLINGSDTLTVMRLAEETTTAIGGFDNVTAGAEADIDNMQADIDTTTFVTTDEDAEGRTHTLAVVDTTYAGYTVESVVNCVSAKAVPGNALYLKGRSRISSTNYDETGLFPPTTRFEPMGFRMDLDPSTGSAWASIAAVEAAELGWILDTTS